METETLSATTDSTPEQSAELAEQEAAQRTQTMIIAGGIAFLVLLIAAIVLMASFPKATAVIRDIAIVFVAVTTFLIGLAVILLIVQIQTLIQVLRDEIQPLLRSFNTTASTVKGTTEFVSHNVVTPFIKFSSTAAGVSKVVNNLTHVLKGMRPRAATPHATPTQSQTIQTGGKINGQAGE